MNDPKTTHDELTATFGADAARSVEDALLESFNRICEDVGPVRFQSVDGYVQASLDGAVVAVLPLYLAKTRTWIMGEVEA